MILLTSGNCDIFRMSNFEPSLGLFKVRELAILQVRTCVSIFRFQPSIREGLKEFADEIFSPLGPDVMLVDEDTYDRPSKKDSTDNTQVSSSSMRNRLLALEYLKQLSNNPSSSYNDNMVRIDHVNCCHWIC